VLVPAILLGGLNDVPIKRIIRAPPVVYDPLAVFGLAGLGPQAQLVRSERILALNVGGCIVPTLLAAYEARHVAVREQAGWSLTIATLVTTVVC